MSRIVQLLEIISLSLLVLARAGLGELPPNRDPDRARAIASEQAGDNTEAEKWWKAYLASHARSAEANAHFGLAQARQGHYKEAIRYYRRAMTLDPDMPGLRLNLGLSFFKTGALKDAINAFSPLLSNGTNTQQERQRLDILIGMSYYGLGEYQTAIPFLKESAAGDAQSLWLRLALAQSCLGAKQYQCVLDVYRQILNLNAESAEADMLAGEALDEMKDHPGAINQFRAATKADPKLPNVHFGLGYILWTQNRFDEAAPEFKAELQNVPNHPQALTYLGDVEIKLGNESAARSLLEKAVQGDPKIALTHLDLGIVYGDLGKTNEALQQMRLAERLDPTNQNVHWRLGRFLKSIGRDDEAKIEFAKTHAVQKAADESLFEKLHPKSSASNMPDARPQVPGFQ